MQTDTARYLCNVTLRITSGNTAAAAAAVRDRLLPVLYDTSTTEYKL